VETHSDLDSGREASEVAEVVIAVVGYSVAQALEFFHEYGDGFA